MNIIDAIILSAITSIIGFICGRAYTVYLLVRRVNEEIKLLEDVMDNDKNNMIFVSKFIAEKNNNTYFLYEQGTERFMGKGDTLEDLAKSVQDNEHIDHALVTLSDGTENNLFWFHKGEVSKL